ncbi:MAG: NAD-dependent epimerase/dehydratase family protein, partial [Sulfurospirillaceae bacterium]|nr:NAD-dependent epimerase/dehydratase family protein [Sulfurospirillaceae bacterium]
MKQKVLITGLEGFTGAHLEQLLQKRGYEVYGTSLTTSEKPNIFTCNITKRIEIETIVHQVAPDFVIHLAGIAFVAEKNASLIYDVNVIGTGHLLEALAHL